jgi:hypothetical protein
MIAPGHNVQVLGSRAPFGAGLLADATLLS